MTECSPTSDHVLQPNELVPDGVGDVVGYMIGPTIADISARMVDCSVGHSVPLAVVGAPIVVMADVVGDAAVVSPVVGAPIVGVADVVSDAAVGLGRADGLVGRLVGGNDWRRGLAYSGDRRRHAAE